MNIVTNNKWIGQRTIRPDGADKVTGRAAFAADTNMPGMIWGKVLRSPHPHARIKSIDTSKAEALPGVKAVVSARDIVDFPIDKSVMLGIQDMRWMCRNVMAREKALFPGHPVAAVAATTEAIAAKACELIEVEYEVLPWSIEIDDAIKPDAPILHDFMKFEGKPSNIAGKLEVKKGDVDQGFKQAEVVVERTFTTRPVHQGYIEPHACLVSVGARQQDHDLELEPGPVHGARDDGVSDRHSAERHPRHPRRNRRRLRRQDHRLSRAAGDAAGEKIRPSGQDGDDPRGSDAGDRADLGLQEHGQDRREEGRHHRRRRKAPSICRPARCRARRSAARSAAASRPTISRTCCRSASTCCPTAPRSRPIAPRARRSAPMRWSACSTNSPKRSKMDPLELRLKNAAKQGTKAAYGPVFPRIGYIETLEAAKAHPHYSAPLGKLQGRGVASGFWFNAGGESSAQVNITEDGNVVVTTGHPDIGGSRAAIANICAELLGIDYKRVSVLIGDTATIGFSNLTGGSRVLFASAIVVTQSTDKIIATLKERAAKIWDIDPEAVKWENGAAHPASPNAGQFEPLTLAELAAKAPTMGGPIGAGVQLNTEGAEGGFGTHICDVEVDTELGIVRVIRYTAVQDVGRAIHPGYVEGQMQGGVAQGIGWALNEEYIYNKDGKVDNPGFLDYRMPVCSDLPMLDCVMVEVPNPKHPQGRKGRRRSAAGPGDGRRRQRHPQRARQTLLQPADVAAEGAGGAGRTGDASSGGVIFVGRISVA